jgi:hypothetical protein
VSTPSPGTEDNELAEVAALAANDVWAVGNTEDMGGFNRTLVEHWNGTAWSVISSPNASNYSNYLNSITAAGPNELLAVGRSDQQFKRNTLAQRYHNQCVSGSPTATFTPTQVPPSCQIHFEDVTNQSWFYPYVQYLYCHQVISGYSSVPPCSQPGQSCFAPNKTTTRGQVAKIVAKAYNLTINTAGGPHFSDVPVGSTFYPYIETLYNMGLVAGYGDGTFRPGAFVTRGQISKIVVSAAVATDPAHWQLLNPANNTFDDVTSASTFYKYVETASAHSILAGYPCGVSPAGPCGGLQKPYFITNNNTTRAQISKIVYLAVGP